LGNSLFELKKITSDDDYSQYMMNYSIFSDKVIYETNITSSDDSLCIQL